MVGVRGLFLESAGNRGVLRGFAQFLSYAMFTKCLTVMVFKFNCTLFYATGHSEVLKAAKA